MQILLQSKETLMKPISLIKPKILHKIPKSYQFLQCMWIKKNPNNYIQIHNFAKNLNNGYTKEEHIKELFENANLKQMHEDSKQRKEIQNVYRFLAPLSFENKQADALIIMFEKIEGNNKIYSLELQGLE